jgi:hypothetical protein
VGCVVAGTPGPAGATLFAVTALGTVPGVTKLLPRRAQRLHGEYLGNWQVPLLRCKYVESTCRFLFWKKLNMIDFQV